MLRDSFAITIEPFVVLDARSGNEHGARIQIRRVNAGVEPVKSSPNPSGAAICFASRTGQPTIGIASTTIRGSRDCRPAAGSSILNCRRIRSRGPLSNCPT